MKYFVDGLNSIGINDSVVTLQFVNVQKREQGVIITDKHEIVLTKESLDNAKNLIEKIYNQLQELSEEQMKEESTEDKLEEVTNIEKEKKRNKKKK